MTDANIADRLGNLDREWKDAPSGGSGMPPDGDYQGLIERFDWPNNDWGLQLETEITVTSPSEYKGRTVKTWHDVEDPEKFKWLKSHLGAMGLDVDQISLRDLYAENKHLEALLAVPVEFRIQTKTKKKNGEDKSYTNVYVNRRLGDPVERADLPVDQTAIGASAASDSDDDIPF